MRNWLRRFQVVWWGWEWQGVRFERMTGNWALIYRWMLVLGVVELRFWAPGPGEE